MRISDWSSDVCSSDMAEEALHEQAQQEPVPQPGRLEVPESFAAAVALVREQGEGILANHLMDDVHLVRYEPGRVELRVTDAAPANLDRKSVGSGQSVAVSVDLGGGRIIKKKKKKN